MGKIEYFFYMMLALLLLVLCWPFTIPVLLMVVTAVWIEGYDDENP